MNRKWLAALCFAGLIDIADAGVLLQRDSFGTPGSSTDLPLGTIDEVLTVAGFDSTLGVLTGVQLRFQGSVDLSGEVNNLGAGPASYHARATLAQDWVLSSSLFSDQVLGGAGETLIELTGTVAGGQTSAFADGTGVIERVFTGLDLGAFLNGPVEVHVGLAVDTSLGVSADNGVGGFATSISTGGWGSLEVTYFFDEIQQAPSVPEPLPLWLLTCAGVVLAGRAVASKRA